MLMVRCHKVHLKRARTRRDVYNALHAHSTEKRIVLQNKKKTKTQRTNKNIETISKDN